VSTTDGEQYPRHPWQSWRDRYLKQLRTRPPSAFNIPDNAPPSPPSDNPPTKRPRPAPAATKPKKKPSPREERTKSPDKVSGEGRRRAPPTDQEEYSLAQLEATFSSDDWEELYAFVDVIEAAQGQARYNSAWEQWAESQENQTPEQWRQYYEKVVRPQWVRDPQWKRDEIQAKMEKKHGFAPTPKKSTGQRPPRDPEEEDLAPKASPAAQRASPKKLKKTSEAEDEGYTASLQATENVQPSEVKLMSSSTAQYESPRIVEEMYQNTLKRVRDGYVYEETGQQGQLRPVKRQKTSSPVPEHDAGNDTHIGTQNEPVDISSSHSSMSASQLGADDEQAQDQIRTEAQRSLDAEKAVLDDLADSDDEDGRTSRDDQGGLQSEGSDDGFLDIDRLPPPPQELNIPSEDDLPSDTPTPRASHQKRNNFDTQAILSSPSQDIGIAKLPRPLGYTQTPTAPHESRSSSLVPQPQSEASTTQSLEEFRRSLSDEKHHDPNPPSRAHSFSPNPDKTAEDPDPPLSASEFDPFYAHFNNLGFSDDFISAALKRTRCRPELAEQVLDAWNVGKPLPNQRGIWSRADDEAAEHGDGEALERLERKHTLDGWGGITERVKFLEGYRNR